MFNNYTQPIFLHDIESMEFFFILVGMALLVPVCIALSQSNMLRDEFDEDDSPKTKNTATKFQLQEEERKKALEYSKMMDEKRKRVAEEERKREEEKRKREEEKYNLIKSDDGNELSENTSLPPLVLSNYHESSNIKIDMIHDVFINRFKELNIKGEVYAEREHVRGLLGHLIVVVSDIRINIMRIDENKYCIQYINNYELPDHEESQLNTHFENIFDEVIKSASFDSFNVFPLKLYCGRGLYGQTTDYQMELSIESEINSISMWGFTQYIFEIWKDLTKFASIMERSL